MEAHQLRGCCTGRILSRFGQSHCAEGQYDASNRNQTAANIKLGILKDARDHREQAFLMVTSNNEQKLLNEVLRDLGFEHSTWMSKQQHSETRVRIWWKHIPTLLKWK